MNYYGAKSFLGDRESRKLARNTYLERRDEKTIAVRLHSTDILTFTPGYVEYDSGGWHTMTTWARMSEFGPMRVGANRNGATISYQDPADQYMDKERGYIMHPHRVWVYYDGIRVYNNGKGILKTQPNRPKEFAKVVTRSGFTGLTRGEAEKRDKAFHASLGWEGFMVDRRERSEIAADERMSLKAKHDYLMDGVE